MSPVATEYGMSAAAGRVRHALVAGLFLAALWTPLVLFALRLGRPDAQVEMRNLAPKPLLGLMQDQKAHALSSPATDQIPGGGRTLVQMESPVHSCEGARAVALAPASPP